MGLGFIATVRKDGGPRVHPVCPVISPAGLHVLILPGPKRGDLRRDGRYSLHTEMFAPPREDDGFAVSGTAAEITDTATWETVRAQVIEDFGELWPNYDTLTLFELSWRAACSRSPSPGRLRTRAVSPVSRAQLPRLQCDWTFPRPSRLLGAVREGQATATG